MEKESEEQINNSENLISYNEEEKNSIAEGGPVIGSDIPTYPDKVYRSVKGLGAIEDLYDSGVVRSSVVAKENKELDGNTNSKGKKVIYWTRGAEGKAHMLPKEMYLIEAPYDIAKERLVKKEDLTAIYSKLEDNSISNLFENPEKLEADIIQYRLEILSTKIEKEKSVIDSTTSQVNTLRHEQLSLVGEEINIPSIKTNKKYLEELDSQKRMLTQRLSEISRENNLVRNTDEVAKQSTVEEKTKLSVPPLPGSEPVGPVDYVEPINISHEMGHLAQDGLLNSEQYKSINLQTKENSPDPEYVGDILETDARIRSMFRDLAHVFDPQKERFTQEHLDLLRSRSTKSKDTKDLFDHYDDTTIIKLANELPAI